MLLIFFLLVLHEPLLNLPILAKECDSANYICSGRCVDVPPDVQLSNGAAICMKHSTSNGCVCWMQSNISHNNSLFICEALVNDSVSQILCRTPTHCFPSDSDPTCLVIPFCNCLLMNDDDSASLKFKEWKPVKAIIQTIDYSEKYSGDIREFSLKHLLFLLAFVVAPLLCWCLLNVINENKCRCKIKSNPCSLRVTTERTPERNTMQGDEAQGVAVSNSSPSNCNEPLMASHPVMTSRLAESLSSPASLSKEDNPPSYNEVLCLNAEYDDDTLPPPYETVSFVQGAFLTQSGTCDNV